MIHVLLAQFHGLGIVFDVVITIGERHSSLIGFCDGLGRVLEILIGGKSENSTDCLTVKPNDFFRQVGFRFEAVDGLEFVCKWSRAGCFDRGFIDAGLIIVADFLLYRAACGIVRSVLFQDSAHGLLAAFLQLVETPPAWMVARDRILRLPFAASVAVKVSAGVDILVEHVYGKADMSSLWLAGGGSGLSQGQTQEGKQE